LVKEEVVPEKNSLVRKGVSVVGKKNRRGNGGNQQCVCQRKIRLRKLEGRKRKRTVSAVSKRRLEERLAEGKEE